MSPAQTRIAATAAKIAARKVRPYGHLYLAGAMVNSAEARLQARARQAGITTLAEYHAWKRAQR